MDKHTSKNTRAVYHQMQEIKKEQNHWRYEKALLSVTNIIDQVKTFKIKKEQEISDEEQHHDIGVDEVSRWRPKTWKEKEQHDGIAD
jgi:hypothetical protein